jgi:hypothetical protein
MRKLWVWRNGDHLLAYDNEFPCYKGGGDPLTLGEPIGWAVLEDSDNRDGKNPARSTITRLLDEVLSAQTRYATEWNKGLGSNQRVLNDEETRRDAARKLLMEFACGAEVTS